MTRLHKQRLDGVIDCLRAGARSGLAVALAIAAPGLAYSDEPLQEVTVTGTRIISVTGMTTPTPVTAVSAAELKQMAPSNLIDSLAQLPQFFGNIGSQQIVGGQNSGGANVNLRGAGVNRTLVLLDGRRVVSSNRFGTVDVNMFPEALLKGIETVTGGASASYGTDAVAGVVNFLLDDRFEGVKLNAQGGETTRSDGGNWKGSIAFGHAFGERFHVVGSAQMDALRPINSAASLHDRSYFNQESRVTDPNPGGPAELVLPFVEPTNFSNRGVIVQGGPTAAENIPAVNRLEFQPDGSLKPLNVAGIGAVNNGCQCISQPTQTYGVNGDREVASGYKRVNAFLHADFDVTDNFNVYVQGLHGRTLNDQRRESVALLSIWQARVYTDNAYLTPATAAFLNANIPASHSTGGVPYFGFGVFGLNTPASPLGDTRQDTDNHMDAATLGFKSEFTGGFLTGWKMNGYVQHGENRQDFIAKNGIRVDRLPLALDAVRDPNGNIVCRVSLPQFDPTGIFKGCVPINLFGGLQNITPAAAAWIINQHDKDARQSTQENVGEIVLSGDVWKGWGAGAIQAAFGGSYRKETLSQRTVDPSDEFPALPDGTLLSSLGIAPAGIRGVIPQGNTSVPGYTGIPGLRFVPSGFLGDGNSSSIQFSSLRTIAGSYNVKEAFTEFNVPILKDAAFAHALDFNAAGRWADYSGSGRIWAWKYGVSWAIDDQVRLRATESRDVRAATLQERFDQTRGGVNVTDPANGNALVSTASFSGGNPNVNPEKADTTTIGIVYQPHFLESFSASLDWYSIDLSDAIAQLASQNVVTGCFNGDQSLCQYVHRAGNLPNGNIDRVDNLFINLANQRISGIDLETSYRHSLHLLGGGAESLAWRLYATYLHENSIQNKGAARDELAGQLGPGLPSGAAALPKYKFTTNLTYGNGPFAAFLQGRFIGDGILDRTRVQSSVAIPGVATIDNNHVASQFLVDLNLSFTHGDNDNYQVYLNVTNLLDRAPVLSPSVIGRTGPVEFNTFLTDVVGRRFVVGVNARF